MREKLSNSEEFRKEKLSRIVGAMSIIGQEMEAEFGEQMYPPAMKNIEGLGKALFMTMRGNHWVRISQTSAEKLAEVDIHFTKDEHGSWILRGDETAQHAISFMTPGEANVDYYPLELQEDGNLKILNSADGFEIEKHDLVAAVELAEALEIIITDDKQSVA